MEDDNVDVRFAIKVATIWRKLIGDAEYTRHLPSDLFRWYQALELAGPDDVRELFNRDQINRPMKTLYGLVGTAPHPPAHLVQAWLESHETKIHTAPYWYGAAVFTSLVFMGAVYLNGFQNLQPVNPFYLDPPLLNTVVAAAPQAMPLSPNTPVPTSPAPPVSQLPVGPSVVVSLPVSTIPVLASQIGGMLRTLPMQEVPTDAPQAQYGMNGHPNVP
jgi:hypothetical protein